MAENTKTVPIITEIGELRHTINIDIPLPVWQQSVKDLTEEVLDDIADSVEDEDDEIQASGYIDADGRSHDCDGELAEIAWHLSCRCIDVVGWLDSCHMLDNLRSTLIQKLEEDPKTQAEANMLKDAEDTLTAFQNWEFNVDDESKSEQIVLVEAEFPIELLRDIYNEMKSR